MEPIFELMTGLAFLLEYAVFLCMIIPFFMAMNNPPSETVYDKLARKEEEDKKEKIEQYKRLAASFQLNQQRAMPQPVQIVQML